MPKQKIIGIGGKMVTKEEYMQDCSKHFKNISKSELSSIFKELDRQGIDWQKIDLMAFGDDCDYDMLLQQVFQEYATNLTPPEKQKIIDQQRQDIAQEYMNPEAVTNLLDNCHTISILADRNSGKTNLLIYLAKNYKGSKKIVMFGYPKDLGYERVFQLNRLGTITDSIILFDEIERYVKIYQNSTNQMFLDLLCMMAHQNNTLIFTTPLTQAITKATDNFIDAYIYMKMRDLGSLKNGSKAKRLLQGSCYQEINSLSANIPLGQFIVISDYVEGKFGFKDMGIGKDWRMETPNKPQNLSNKKYMANPKDMLVVGNDGRFKEV
jgi:hypothetical protein